MDHFGTLFTNFSHLKRNVNLVVYTKRKPMFADFLEWLEWILTSDDKWIIIGIIAFVLLYKSLRYLILSLINDFKWLIVHLVINPLKAIFKGIAYVLNYPSRVIRRKRLKESQFNVIPTIDYSTY